MLAYDICEDEPTLDYIESEMARRGVTQEVTTCIRANSDMINFYLFNLFQLIDQTRASNERRMLAELKVN